MVEFILKRLFGLALVCLLVGACAGPKTVEEDPTSLYDVGINYDIIRLSKEGLDTGQGGGD
ncbi:hypothetical protein ACFL17_07680 [Pseudomonadota bacterium]